MSKYQHYANCKDCFAEIEYKDNKRANRAERDGICCKVCKAKKKEQSILENATRHCPSRDKPMSYKYPSLCKEAIATGETCHQCRSVRLRSPYYSGLTRNCPSCNLKLHYSCSDAATKANRIGDVCKSCSLKGQIPSAQCQAAALKANTGIKRTPEHMAAIIAANIGITRSPETRLKLSIALKGRVFSAETLERMKIAKNRLYGRPDNYISQKISGLGTWSRKARRKTPYCEICNSRSDLHAHHIKPKCLFPELALDLSNAMVLCYECHKLKHKRGWLSRFTRNKRYIFIKMPFQFLLTLNRDNDIHITSGDI